MAQLAGAAEWRLVWSDEFDYTGLPSPDKWGYEEGFVRNRELQYYTRERLENVRVEDGVLVIEGRREPFENPRYDREATDWRRQRRAAGYTSGSINTQGKAAFLYGRIEVRAKLPRGRGVWPAIWMMGTNRVHVGWPRCGEIDVMEYVGKEPDTIHATTHYADPFVKGTAVHKSAGGSRTRVEQPYRDFHLYAIEWNEERIMFLVDGRQYGVLDLDRAGKGAENPFRRPHYLLLNLALGGSWGGPMDDDALPQRYVIDYVRVYERSDVGK